MTLTGYRGKIKPDHAEPIVEAIRALDTEDRRARYLAGDFPRAHLVNDLDRRYRWDLLWACETFGSWDDNLLADIHTYANDDHVDTLLRFAIPALEA